MAAVLVDTNVLIYGHDPSDLAKQARAIEALDHLHANGAGRISSQTLAEFFAAATRGARPLLTETKASRQVENFAQSWVVFDITPLVVLEGVRGVRSHKFSYWDAQLWATARLNQVSVIFSEDFNPGSTIDGVRFVNPFAADFVLKAWT
jgi:predicted nucleic acid-binding protein